MELAQARALVQDKTDNETTVRHLISVEGMMRALARRLGQDQHRWALAGLSHDLDQDRTGEDSNRHVSGGRVAARGRSGGAGGQRRPGPRHERYRTDLMAKAVVHAGAIAGLLVAAALVRPERSAGMKVSSVKKKLKERSFAPGVDRDEVYAAEAVLGLPWRSSSLWPLPASSRSHRTSGSRPRAGVGRPVRYSVPTSGGGPQRPKLGSRRWTAGELLESGRPQ
jgi:predicted hydrolase (HD superfamily)